MLIALVIFINSFVIYVFYKLIQNSSDKQAKIFIIIAGILAVSSVSNIIIKSNIFHNIIVLLAFINFIIYISKNNLKNRKIRKGLISLLQVGDYILNNNSNFAIITEITKDYIYLKYEYSSSFFNKYYAEFKLKKSKIKYSNWEKKLYYNICDCY